MYLPSTKSQKTMLDIIPKGRHVTILHKHNQQLLFQCLIGKHYIHHTIDITPESQQVSLLTELVLFLCHELDFHWNNYSGKSMATFYFQNQRELFIDDYNLGYKDNNKNSNYNSNLNKRGNYFVLLLRLSLFWYPPYHPFTVFWNQKDEQTPSLPTDLPNNNRTFNSVA